MDDTRPRLVLDLGDCGLPEVSLVGRYDVQQARWAIEPHQHTAVELTLVTRGQIHFQAQGQDYLCRGGEWFITAPGIVHGTGDRSLDKCQMYWLNIELPKRHTSWLGLAPANARPLLDALRAMQVVHCRAEAGQRQRFERILRLAQQPIDCFQTLDLSLELTALLREIVAAPAVTSAPLISDSIAMVCTAIDADPAEPWDIPACAVLAKLSLSRFKARFKQEIGMPPAEYIIRRRLEKSLELIRQQRAITDVAFAVGFNSSQHFATVFRRFYNCSPSEWRQAHAIALSVR